MKQLFRVVLFCIASTAAFAQSSTQGIQGLVTDSTGAVVSGAKVTVTNTAQGVALTAETNDGSGQKMNSQLRYGSEKYPIRKRPPDSRTR